MIKPQKAVILIAGLGKRLRPLTDKIPKCLIEINRKTILANTLENLEQNGIEETILVVGHLKDKIKAATGKNFGKMKISYIENNLYNKTNNSYSLWLALKGFEEKENLLILEGDVFFEKKLLEDFLADERENLTIVEKYRPGLDGTFVKIGKRGEVVSWVHKKDRPKNFVLSDQYKTINIHKFSADFIKRWIKPILRKYPREPIESVFSEIIKNGGKIYAFDAKTYKWAEIDDVNDLKYAQARFR